MCEARVSHNLVSLQLQQSRRTMDRINFWKFECPVQRHFILCHSDPGAHILRCSAVVCGDEITFSRESRRTFVPFCPFVKIYWKSSTRSVLSLRSFCARVISHNKLNVEEQFEQSQRNRHEVLIHYITKLNIVLPQEGELIVERLLERTEYFRRAFALDESYEIAEMN